MSTVQRRRKPKRRLRKSIRYALYVIFFVGVIWFMFMLLTHRLSFIGVKSANEGAAKAQYGKCLVFYPENSKKGKEQAKKLCEGVEEKTVFDYTLVPYGECYQVEYPGASYIVNGDQTDLTLPESLDENGKTVLRDYLIYTLKKNGSEVVRDRHFYDRSDFEYEIREIRGSDLDVYFPEFDVDAQIPLAFLASSLGKDFGTAAATYQKPMFFDPNQKYLCLTFDDGPSRQTSRELMELLNHYDARATFYIVGSRLYEPDIEQIKESVSYGNEFGSHTQSHADLTKLSTAEAREEIMIPYNDLKNGFGYEMKTYRPPYGAYNHSLDDAVNLKPVLWDIDSRDWAIRNSSEIIQKVKAEYEDNTIVLFHEIYQETVDSMKELIPYFIEQGSQLITVSEADGIN